MRQKKFYGLIKRSPLIDCTRIYAILCVMHQIDLMMKPLKKSNLRFHQPRPLQKIYLIAARRMNLNWKRLRFGKRMNPKR